MAGQTIIQKIMSAHSKEEVKTGDIVWIDLDIRTARDFGGANVIKNLEENYEGNYIADLEKTFFTFDCNVPANNIPYANNQHIIRLFARKTNMKVYDVNIGIGTHVGIEKGYIYPGITAVGTDSHYNIVGAVGAFGQGMGDKDISFAFKTGKTWFEVPETIKVIIKGELKYPASARDLTLKVVGTLGSAGALGKCIEYYGEAIDKLKLYERITLASMATEMGAISSFITPNEEIMKYCSERANKKLVDIFAADSDAEYCQVIEIDINGLQPQIACPAKPDNVKNVADVGDVEVDSIFIGSCTNGRYEDMKVVADYLKGKKIHPRVMVKIVPATREVYAEMLKNGLIEILFEAGAIISHSGCGGCASGQLGMTGTNEVQISTSNRNFKGKQGNGLTYLASPLTAAASAVAGKIVSV